MKLLIELDVEVDGKISDERIKTVVANHIIEAGPVLSESHGDGESYYISVESVEVKEVK